MKQHRDIEKNAIQSKRKYDLHLRRVNFRNENEKANNNNNANNANNANNNDGLINDSDMDENNNVVNNNVVNNANVNNAPVNNNVVNNSLLNNSVVVESNDPNNLDYLNDNMNVLTNADNSAANVVNVNDAPSLSAISDPDSVNEDEDNITIQIQPSDIDGDILSVEAVSSNTNLIASLSNDDIINNNGTYKISYAQRVENLKSLISFQKVKRFFVNIFQNE